jgi:tRNA 5-methylaminomethyl-2-thiouridine biosynthesis bifunctional protein
MSFLQDNRLKERFASLSAGESFTIGETRFGSGLNFLSAWQLFEQTAPAGTSLDFFSIEKFPLIETELRAGLALLPEFQHVAALLLKRWPRLVPGWNRWSFLNGRVRLTLVIGEAANVSSPSVRKGTPQTVIVIGGGVAGCAVAHALATRGVTVKLLERSAQLAGEASGNPRGILHARFGAADNPLNRFVLAAYGHALALFDEVLPVDGALRSECGLLQLDCSANENKRMTRLAEQTWPESLLQIVDAGQATALSGMKMSYGGLWFPAGGWVVPPKLCARLADDPRIEVLLSHTVESLTQSDNGWIATGQDGLGGQWAIEAEAVVVCCAHSALALEPFAHFPLTPSRGQVSLLPATEHSSLLKAVICGDGYCAPAFNNLHITGATHAFNDESSQVRLTDHTVNLEKLAAYAPALRTALGELDVEHLSGRASVRCSAPGSTPLVGEVQAGLYCSLAHGTRGLLTAGLSGETVAAMVCGQLPPLPLSILDALSPRLRIAALK